MQPLVANLTLLLQLLAQSGDKSKYDELSATDKLSPGSLFFKQSESFVPNEGCRYDVYENDECKSSDSESDEIGNLPTSSMNNKPRRKRNGLRCPKWLWPNGRVPFDNRLVNETVQANFLAAVQELNALDCVRFERRTAAEARSKGKFLAVVETPVVVGKSCAATAGTTAAQPKILLSHVCTKGKIVHELMHALGFAHEHQRPDRDEFVTIRCRNVIDNVTQDFRKLKRDVVDTFDQPYDFMSIMHYRLDHFSKNGEPTIVPTESALKNIVDVHEIGSMKRLSESDVVKIKRMYCPHML